MILLCSILLAGAASATVPPSTVSPAGPPPPPVAIRVTPTTVRVGPGPAVTSANPIAQALADATPGSIVDVAPGTYTGFTIGGNSQAGWNARTTGGLPGQPITVRGAGHVVIRPDKGSGDTITIQDQVKCGHITFEGITIVPGYRAGVMFFASKRSVYEGFRFWDCDILGEWDHVAARGPSSKWGVYGRGLKDFEFVGRRRPARIENLRHEHAFYLQNPRGDILIENVHGKRLGRTFCQFTARPNEGPPGVGTVTVRNCVAEDTCIGAGDNYKGGSGFTIAGRHEGEFVFENNRFSAGFDPQVKRLTTRGVPYGTGAFVAWAPGTAPNRRLVLRGNTFEMAPGCGDRALVTLGGCDEVVLEENRFTAGGYEIAVDVDPLGDDRKLRSPPVGDIRLAGENLVQGKVRRRGRETTLAELAGAEEARQGEQQH